MIEPLDEGTMRGVAEVMSSHGARLGLSEITQDTAMSQDARIDGIEVDDFVFTLEKRFGAVVWSIPWGRFSDQRASFRGCIGCLVFPAWLAWRVFARIRGEPLIPPPNGGEERITVGHIARVIDQGFWSEPES